MTKKYELLQDDFKTFLNGNKVFRIRALIDIPKYGVKIGDLGGYIEKEDNLSHFYDCWVSGNAQVSGNARVSDNAQVFGNSYISGNAQIYGNSRIFDDAWVYGNAHISGDASVYGIAQIHNGKLRVDARVSGHSLVDDLSLDEFDKIFPHFYDQRSPLSCNKKVFKVILEDSEAFKFV